MSQDNKQPPPTPHDALFKVTFERAEHAAGMLRALLPAEVTRNLELSKLELVPGSFLDEELREVETDLLYRTDLAGSEAFVYVVLEHQSSVDSMMAWRMHRYVTRVLEHWARAHPTSTRLPAVLPVVVAHAERPWRAPTSLIELFDVDERTTGALGPYLSNLRFLLVDLTTMSPDALRARTEASPLSRLVLFLLQRARTAEDLLSELGAWAELWRRVEEGIQGKDDVVSLVLYTRVIAGVPPAELRAFLRGALVTTDPDEVMTAAEKLITLIGPPKWRQEGVIKGKAEMLLRQLTRRFGPLSATHEERVRSATIDELDVMAERVLDAARLEDVLG